MKTLGSKASHHAFVFTAPCHADGCSTATADRKPYCARHTKLNAYAAKLVDDQRVLEREVARLRKGHADAEGMLAQEALNAIAHYGPLTVHNLGKLLRAQVGQSKAAVHALCVALVEAGKAKWVEGERYAHLAPVGWEE